MEPIIKEALPIGDRVLIRIPNLEKETRTASGLYMPDSVKKQQSPIGKIVAIGNKEVAQGLEVGESVMFAQFNMTPLTIEGNSHIIIPIADIICKLAL